MLRICRQCGLEYDGDPGSTLCHSCVREGRKTTIRDRTCRACGITFPGGPRAWYCLDCRNQRKKAQTRDYQRRKAAGKTRPIGSEDLCEICGKPYMVTSGLQRYCPACAPGAWAEADRLQGRTWYAANGDPDARRELRQAHAAELLCAVCGQPYKPTDASKTCSNACSAELAKRNMATWEKSHREERNKYRRERLAKQKEENTIPNAEPLTVREICTAANLTQAALAARFGIPKRTVEDWCAGKRQCAPYIRLMMCECLGLIHR